MVKKKNKKDVGLMKKRKSALTPSQVKAVDALFLFDRAMTCGLTINDLACAFSLAILGGWDRLEIELVMAIEAIRIARQP